MAEKMSKSQFSLTCSRLSHYLKEKGSFGSISLDMAPMPLQQHQPKEKSGAPTTLSLLPGVDVSTEDQCNTQKNTLKSMELFPQHAGFDLPAAKEESVKAPSSTKEAEKAKLTIFYNGKVLVFDDFSEEKARDLIQMAGRDSNLAAQKFASATGSQPPAPPQKEAAQLNASDMPIARRNSLHRFLEKRKDRINTKAPYQVNGGGSPAPEDAGKPEDGQVWLGLGRQSVKQEPGCESSR